MSYKLFARLDEERIVSYWQWALNIFRIAVPPVRIRSKNFDGRFSISISS